jgi:hypothetical protein
MMSRALVVSVLVGVSRAVTRAHGASPALLLALAAGLLACSPDSGEGQPQTKNPSQEPADHSSDHPSDDGASEPALQLDASKPAAKDAGGGAPKDAGKSPGKDAGSTQASDASTTAPTNDDAGATSGDAGSAVGGDAGSADSGGPVLPQLGKCESLSTEPCGTFVTGAGTELPLGKYGAVMEPNVGVGFENKINSSDTTAGCTLFAQSFGQDKAQTDELVDLHGLNLALYTVYRPANWIEGEKYPIVSWGNGTCAKPEGYGALLRYVASQGFFVVAANSRYVGSGNEQKHAIDFAFKANDDAKSPYYQRLDTSRVAAMGHSQGSISTTAASSDARIKTVILFNGGTNASKPFLGVSGDRDLGSPTANTYKTAVNKVAKAAYIFFHKVPGTGSADGHLTLMTQPERVTEPTVAWLKLLLSDDADSKEWFVGTSCKLCGHEADYDFGQKGL